MRSEELGSFVKSKKVKPAAAALLLLSIGFLISGWKGVLVSVLIVIDLILARFLLRFQVSFIGLELGTLVTILSGLFFGAEIGAFTGAGIILLRVLTAAMVGPFLLWKIPGFALLGFFSGMIQGDLYSNTMILAGFMRVAFISCIYKMMTSRVAESVMYSVTSLYLTSFILKKILQSGLIG